MTAMSPAASTGLQSPHRSGSKNPVTPNVANVMLGSLHIKTWYPSFYPEDLIGGRRIDWLYVCEWCFRYTSEIMKYSTHCKVCPMKSQPPIGRLIYENDQFLIYQFDGEDYKLYAQNLSLFAKLFLETKSVFFDASTFLYYTLVLKDASPESQGRVVGFFSKEKMSWDNNNLACILIFPPWQKRGLGQVLIRASYVLGKQEGRFGGPEKPLSNLGRKGYVFYWSGEIARNILDQPNKKTITVKELSEQTWILPEDLIMALLEMDVLENRKTPSGSTVVNKTKIREWVEKYKVRLTPIIADDAFS